MACDVCNKKGTNLTTLRSEYQTDDIKDVCARCASDINSHLWKLRNMATKMNQHWLKRFIAEKKINIATK